MTVHEHALVGFRQDGVNLLGHDPEMLLEQRLPFGMVVNGNSVCCYIVTERGGDVSSAVDDETNVVFAHEGFVCGGGMTADPDPIQDLSRRKYHTIRRDDFQQVFFLGLQKNHGRRRSSTAQSRWATGFDPSWIKSGRDLLAFAMEETQYV